MRHLFSAFALVVGLLALALAILAARGLTVPIRDILHFVDGVALGQFHRNLSVETRDEIEALGAGVRDMAEALEAAQADLLRWNEALQAEVDRKVGEIDSLHEGRRTMEKQLLRADRLASLGMLSASLAHEVGNPLAGIKTVIQVHLRSADAPPKTRLALEMVLSEVDRLADFLDRMTGFVRPAAAAPMAVTPRAVFERVQLLIEGRARRKEVELRLEGDALEVSLETEGPQLEQVLLNLVVNALQAMEAPGAITVSVTTSPAGLVLTVTDEGPGIPEILRDKVFDAFFTTKEGGTGLGLPIVRQIVREMGGSISFEHPAEGGAQIRVDLGSPTPLPEAGYTEAAG